MSPAPSRATNLLYRDLHGRDPELVVGAKGSFLQLEDGRQILDACAGAAVASIGHGELRVISKIAEQLSTLSYHHTSRLTNPAAEKLAKILVGDRPGGLSHAIFLSSGSEANESAIKLARQYFVEIGQPDRVHIISRHNSYHGNSIGCVSLTGIPSRRRHFEPMLIPTTSRVSPCYPYRYQKEGESDQEYSQRLADELEQEILRIGEGKVAAFFAETVVGAAAGNLVAVPGYFQEIRRVCDKYGVLLVLDEIMCGMGRTGKLHAWEWEGMTPDIQTIGKGLNGGYQALSAVLISERVVEGLKSGSGAFANGQTFQAHPAAATAGLAVMEIFESDGIVANCASRGKELYNGLLSTLGDHPHVGEIRGRGLFLSLEFVVSKATKSTFPLSLPLAALLDDAIFNKGAIIYSGFGKGTADGIVGDHILLSPPLSITSAEVQLIIQAVKAGIDEVFATDRVQQAIQESLKAV
ncbi:pyridoxal phosphate-dependent transferase [Leucosporidium creatinivorum]|uniref:Pyridoxal phosphate-dependent transferase n=1 Tax=Leucosporidium creatinivorum TaxID=106004 RepID=A0A1Y2C326_9BASI|nr:pyridoxal phosphate-dependent transferase [Leucosporidium creatinivorum]